MNRRGSEPEEAIGPVINGLENFPPLPQPHIQEDLLPEYDEKVEENEVPESIDEPVLLLCGSAGPARETAELAIQCGFVLEVFSEEDEDQTRLHWPEARAVYSVPRWLDLAQICNIDRNYFVCVFLEDLQDCEDILNQCLPSEARYIGVYGDMEKRQEIFSGLRQMGAPDTELVAIACPMGLNIGALTPIQKAVSIVAELMAARAGTLKRLIHGEDKKRRL